MSDFETIPGKVLRRADRRPDDPAYYVRQEGAWVATSWGDFGADIRRAAAALVELGVEPGDTVAILGFNTPEWTIFDLAAMAIGAVPAGIYPTNSPEEVEYVLSHSEAVVALVQDRLQWDKVDLVRDRLAHLRRVVTMAGSEPIDDELVVSWEEFLALSGEVDAALVRGRLAALEPGDLATLIYTSGTTGPPKAVMLSHDNLSWTAQNAVDLLGLGPDERTISYLPLCHIAEQLFTIHGAACTGHQVHYVDDITRLAEFLPEVNPTIFFAVPRVWEKFQAGVVAKLGEASGLRARLVETALDVGRRHTATRNAGVAPSAGLRLAHRLFERLVFSKVKQPLGLIDARITISGAAPISKELVEWFGGLDIQVLEEYGQSENTGIASLNLPHRARPGTAGPVFPGVEVAIAGDGEILVRGRNVFLGYYKDPEATAADLAEGWLHSGDLGEFDDDGFLAITGRKKDIIITAGGKNVAPSVIEGQLKNHELIGEAVVIGDRRKYLTALIALDDEAVERFVAERGLEGPPAEVPAVLEAIQAAIDTVNANLARVEQLKKFTVLPRPLTIDSGELTPTLKVKRNVVGENFATQIESLYADGS